MNKSVYIIGAENFARTSVVAFLIMLKEMLFLIDIHTSALSANDIFFLSVPPPNFSRAF